MKALIYNLPLLFVLFLGCRNNHNVENVYANRAYLTDLCKAKALLKNRGNNFLVFKTFKNNKVNEYYVTLDSGKYNFTRDTIQYVPDILGSKLARNTDADKKEICRLVRLLNEKLDSFGINGFTTGFTSLGEPMKFYMKDGKSIVNIPDLKKIPNDEEYKKRLKKLGESWYYMD